MKKIILILILLLYSPYVYALKPLVGVAVIKSDNPIISNLSSLMETHLVNVIESSGIFDLVNPILLKEQLTKFNCLDEKCILSFAKTAGLNLIINGFLEERGDTVILCLNAYGINTPYYGKIVYNYKVEIPFSGQSSTVKEFNYIFEEHAGFFIHGLLSGYKAQISLIKDKSGKVKADSERIINGKFSVYRYKRKSGEKNDIKLYDEVGRIKIYNNVVNTDDLDSFSIENEDFILYRFSDKADFLEQFYYGRKKEIVFERSFSRDTFLILLSTIPASAVMPIVTPIGHYRSGDFKGLCLWALNYSPYLYLQYDGFKNRPSTYREKKKDIPRNKTVRYSFGLYMLICGGLPLFMDAMAYNQLSHASNYRGTRSFMGNSQTAAYLSLISGGGGLFYRGHRSAGYLYFHLHNILLYSIIKEATPTERYNAATDSYQKEETDKNRLYTYLSIFGVVKLVEVFHAILSKDNIKHGRIIEEKYSFEPEVIFKNESDLNIGAKYIFRF